MENYSFFLPPFISVGIDLCVGMNMLISMRTKGVMYIHIHTLFFGGLEMIPADTGWEAEHIPGQVGSSSYRHK